MRGDEDAERQPSLVPRHSGSGIGQPFQSAQRGQPGPEGIERIAGLSGILLNLADGLVKECFEFPRTWRQAVGFVALYCMPDLSPQEALEFGLR